MSHNSLTTLHGELSSLPNLRVSVAHTCIRKSIFNPCSYFCFYLPALKNNTDELVISVFILLYLFYNSSCDISGWTGFVSVVPVCSSYLVLSVFLHMCRRWWPEPTI